MLKYDFAPLLFNSQLDDGTSMLSELWETLSALVLMQNVASATKILVMRHAMPATFLIRYACPAPALPFHQLLRLKVKAVQRLRKQLAPGELSTVNSKSVSPAFAHDFHIIIINAFLVPPCIFFRQEDL